MLKILLLIIIFLIGGFLRRWLGGGFDKHLSEHRIVCLICMFLFGILMLLIKSLENNYFSLRYLLSVVFYTFLWRGHKGFFTIIDTTPRDRKQPYKWIIEKLFKDKQWGIFANYTGLTMIYCVSCFLVALCIKNLYFSLVGILISTTYLITGKIWKKYYKGDKYIQDVISGKKVWDYTKISEFIVGGIVAICYYLCL